MEFHNATLLPKGLPEIMAKFVPDKFYDHTKVIAFHRRGTSKDLGYLRADHMTQSYHIGLYPTLCCSGAGRRETSVTGVYSFKLWSALLCTALHEIGHLTYNCVTLGIPAYQYSHLGPARWYVERLADAWMRDALGRLVRDDPRLGQPMEALTGYPGVLAYRCRNFGRPWNGDTSSYGRINEWRALKSGGQVTMYDIVCSIDPSAYHSQQPTDLKRRAQLYRLVHEASTSVGVTRFFVNKNGRRYRMFNVAEAEAVWQWLLKNKQKWGLGRNRDDWGELPELEIEELEARLSDCVGQLGLPIPPFTKAKRDVIPF